MFFRDPLFFDGLFLSLLNLCYFVRKRRWAAEAQRQNECPTDMTANNDQIEAFATVHWNPMGLIQYGQGNQANNDMNHYHLVQNFR